MTEPRFFVKIPSALDPLIDALAGKGAGLRRTRDELSRDPCATKAYKAIGALRGRVCGLHLDRGYRLVFTFVPDAPDEECLDREVVAILAVGAKKLDRKARVYPALQLVHEILGEEMPPGSLDRTPCCEDGRPEMSEADVLEAMQTLRKLLRH